MDTEHIVVILTHLRDALGAVHADLVDLRERIESDVDHH